MPEPGTPRPADYVVLPGSHIHVEWRDDGTWRSLPEADLPTPDLPGPAEDWTRWTGSEVASLYQFGPNTGDDTAGRWVLVSELPADGSEVRVWTDDGVNRPVRHVGGLWACEWTGEPQVVHVAMGTDRRRLDLHRKRHYVPELRGPEPTVWPRGWWAGSPDEIPPEEPPEHNIC